ncbi:MAG: 50S ribosomal protein L1, partial [Candidatus Bathyarchaeia archaeon]
PIEEIIAKHRRTIKIRIRDQPAVRCRVATEDMSDEKIVENLSAVIAGVESRLAKGGKNIAAVLLKATMGKPVRVAA